MLPQMYFNAKDELITIVPTFSLPTENATCLCISVSAWLEHLRLQRGLRADCTDVALLQGEWGPFQPNRECQVPLWLAHTLWKRKRCSIRAPAWMGLEHLQAVLNNERTEPGAFQPLPFHYIEVAHFLFTSGTDGNLPQEVFGDELARVREGRP
jgi:GINS complex subunit 2